MEPWHEYRDPAEQAAWLEFLAASSYDLPSEEALEEAAYGEGGEEGEEEDPKDRWHSRGAVAIFSSPFPEIRMLVPDLDFGPGRPTGVWGAPGSGKNLTVQAIGLSIATGRKVLGEFDCLPGKVIHLTWDMGFAATALRYRQLANGMGIRFAELEGRFLLCVHPQIALTAKGALKEFTARLEGFDFAIVDNIREAAPQADENSSDFGGYVSLLGAAAEQAGCVACYLHHTRKQAGTEISATSGRGTSAILAASGCVWGIEGLGDEARKLVHLRAHDMGHGLRDPLWLEASVVDSEGLPFDTGGRPSLHLEARREDPRRASRLAGLASKVLAIVSARPGIGSEELVEAVGKRAVEVRRARDHLVRNKLLIIEKKSNGGDSYFPAIDGRTDPPGGVRPQ